MNKTKYLNNQSFGFLTALEDKPIKMDKHFYQKCRCICGKILYVREDSLLRGTSRSCGCKSKELRHYQFTEKAIAKMQLSKIGKSKYNKSGCVGVNWDKSRGRWQSSIRYNGKKINIGRFDNYEDAVTARKKVEVKILKEIKEKIPTSN